MRVSTVVLAVVLFGCGGPTQDEQDPTPETPGTGARAYALTVEADRQTAPVTSEVNVTATVTTPGALTVAGAIDVSFVVVSGGGTTYITGGKTNDLGQVKNYWTLGPRAGEQVLEVRAVDQASGQKLVTYVKSTATPGPAVTYLWTPTHVDVQAGQAWDYSTVVLYGEDQYGNRVEVPQTQTFRGVWYEGPSVDPTPTCSASGTLLTCPKVAGQDLTTWRAYFDTTGANGRTLEVQLVVR